MRATIREIDYWFVTVPDQPGEGARVLGMLAEAGVSLLAFSAAPLGPGVEQIILVPENDEDLARALDRAGYTLTGPQTAFLIQGEDHIGALLDVHRKLFDARVNIRASTGVTDGRGGFGYVLYLRPEDVRGAADALGV